MGHANTLRAIARTEGYASGVVTAWLLRANVQVRTPDGAGWVSVVVPEGVRPGQSFQTTVPVTVVDQVA
jgi:hypothetical protein